MVEYFGREGRRVGTAYRILHIIRIGKNRYEIAAKTKEAAIAIAKSKEEKNG